MNLVLLAHPLFLGLRSQDHFARQLAEGLRARGHTVDIRRPVARMRAWTDGLGWRRTAKWAGYVDQFLVFPLGLLAAMRHDAPDTLYVVCDQALGPWVPLVARRPHVVHCADLLALESALGLWPQNPVSATGRLYQRWIRAGFRRARHFISISQHSRDALHRVGGVEPAISEVVHLGLNHPYTRWDAAQARKTLPEAGLPQPPVPLLLHVGGGQWYKNTAGVLAIYGALVQRCVAAGQPVPALWLVSPPPDDALREALAALPRGAEIMFLQDVRPEGLQSLYALAEALIFPSLAEGFGWPIVEALACGCPVLTTGEAPMNEVGGSAAHYLPRLHDAQDLPTWAGAGAEILQTLLAQAPAEREARARQAMDWAARFDADRALSAYIAVYERVLAAAGHRSAEATDQPGSAALAPKSILP